MNILFEQRSSTSPTQALKVNRQTKKRRDARLAQAFRGVVKRYAHWDYRLVGRFLQGRGWHVNLKRIHRVWRQHHLMLRTRKLRQKIATGATLQPTAKTKLTTGVGIWTRMHRPQPDNLFEGPGDSPKSDRPGDTMAEW